MAETAQLNRIESAIERLTEISGDLKSMIAVHESRIMTQEKTSQAIVASLEKRREEMDIKLKDVYDTMRSQDKQIIDEIAKLRTDTASQHKNLSERITKLERYIWMAIGGAVVLSWLASYLSKVYLGH